MATPRYDQIAALVLIVAVGLGVIFLIDINPNILLARLGDNLPGIGVTWLLVGLLGLIASAGADALIRGVPAIQQRNLPGVTLFGKRFEVAPSFWILPFFSVVGAYAFFRMFNVSLQGLALVLALLAACGLLFGVLIGQHYALLGLRSISAQARLGLQVIALLLAFACFSAVLLPQFRNLIAAPLIAVVGALLSIAVLHWHTSEGLAVLAAAIGIVLAEATWAINYWGTSFMIAAAVLLLLFYSIVSLLQQFYTQGLRPNVAVEYGLVGGGLLAVLIFAVLR